MHRYRDQLGWLVAVSVQGEPCFGCSALARSRLAPPPLPAHHHVLRCPHPGNLPGCREASISDSQSSVSQDQVVSQVVLYNRCAHACTWVGGYVGAWGCGWLGTLPGARTSPPPYRATRHRCDPLTQPPTHPWPPTNHPFTSRRQDAVPERLTYFEVRVGNVPARIDPLANPVCATYTVPALSVYTITCSPPLVGNRVVVRLLPLRLLPADAPAARDGVLTICELQVFGFQALSGDPAPLSLPLLASQGRPATQSAPFYDPPHLASRAVDGTVGVQFSCTSAGGGYSKGPYGDWWQVDLQDTWSVATVNLMGYPMCAQLIVAGD